MTLKVCQICAVDFTLKNFLVPLVNGMEDEGWRVRSVCSSGPHVSSLRLAGMQITCIPIARSLNPVLAFRSVLLLFVHFRRSRYDVVHVHTPVASFVGRIAARLAGVPLVVYTAHGFYFHDNMNFMLRYLIVTLEKIAGIFTDLLFCQSLEDANSAVGLSLLSGDKIHAIGNGVDVSVFNPNLYPRKVTLRENYSLPVDSFVVTFIGRHVLEKGIDEFLSAVSKLSAVYPQLVVLMVGDRLESDHSRSVMPQIRSAKAIMGDRLLSLGLRDDIPELLKCSDLFCLPSWREGMPRTIIEAMMMQLPVLATDIRGSREEVLHGHTGHLVPVRCPDSLYSSIEYFLNNPSSALSMGLNGRERALRLYDESIVVQKQLNLIASSAREKGII